MGSRQSAKKELEANARIVLRPPKKKGLKKRARRAVILAKKSFDISKV